MRQIKQNKIKIYALIERYFAISVLTILISALSAGLYLNQYEKTEEQKINLQKIHAILSQLISPSLAISDSTEVKRLLYMASSKEETFLVIDADKTIIMPDDTKNYFYEFAEKNYINIKNCSDAEINYKYINSEKYLIHCSIIQSDNLFSEGKNSGILLSFTHYTWLYFSHVVFYFVGILIGLFTILIILFRNMLYHKLLKPLMTLKDRILTISVSEASSTLHIKEIENSPLELIEIKKAFEKLLSNLQEEYTKRVAAEKTQTLLDLSTQVAHDIRSPLSAINTALTNMLEIPENRRILIKNAVKRINDIANNLLLQSRNNIESKKSNASTSELIFVTIDNLVSEKRYEHQNTQIIFDTEKAAYNCFANVSLTSFKRVLSNLINNSIESIRPDGCIKIHLSCSEDNVVISIEDNGCGIPEDILPQIAEKGFSYGKNSGAGLGLYYAKQYIKELNGDLLIFSQINVGTQVKIILPRRPTPSWFCEKIALSNLETIIILDDDPSIHAAWREKFIFFPQLNIINIYEPNNIKERTFNTDESTLYLIDYELIGSNKNGLDAIEENEISNNSILVTSCFEDVSIRNRCKSLGIRIIPKNYVPCLPIESPLTQPEEFILIDDDEIVRNAWLLAARKTGKKLFAFSSIQEFEQENIRFDKKVIIYIDSNLNSKIKGEIYAKNLYERGFTEIHLVTGYPASQFSHITWIKSVIEKDPPFLINK